MVFSRLQAEVISSTPRLLGEGSLVLFFSADSVIKTKLLILILILGRVFRKGDSVGSRDTIVRCAEIL